MPNVSCHRRRRRLMHTLVVRFNRTARPCQYPALRSAVSTASDSYIKRAGIILHTPCEFLGIWRHGFEFWGHPQNSNVGVAVIFEMAYAASQLRDASAAQWHRHPRDSGVTWPVIQSAATRICRNAGKQFATVLSLTGLCRMITAQSCHTGSL